jgi:hypothetical protein
MSLYDLRAQLNARLLQIDTLTFVQQQNVWLSSMQHHHCITASVSCRAIVTNNVVTITQLGIRERTRDKNPQGL